MSTVVSDFILCNSFGCQDTHMQTTGWGVNTRELLGWMLVDSSHKTIIIKTENHSGVSHEKLIPIWKYSNNVFQKLLMIYIPGYFTLSPSEACILFYFIFGSFRQFPIVYLRVTPLWFLNLHI